MNKPIHILNKRVAGFTMIELLIVVTIIGVLAAIGLVSYRGISATARDSKRQADLNTIRQALVLYRSEQGVYPSGTFTDMRDELSDPADPDVDPYLSQPLPNPPAGGGAIDGYTYSSTGTTFCLCTGMEDTDLHNDDGSCSFSGTDLFCMNNP